MSRLLDALAGLNPRERLMLAALAAACVAAGEWLARLFD